MAEKYRVKCPVCGTVSNLIGTDLCPRCSTKVDLGSQGMLHVYRMGNFLGFASGFTIYIDHEKYGAIGNKESLLIPLPFGPHLIHVVCGMNRKCNDPVFTLSPEDPYICAKIFMLPGVFQNKTNVERVDPASMPPM